jgi:thioredoxin reductase (NADPH)
MKIYDLIIIGAGPAGITAGIYAKNFDLDCLIIGQKAGGLINAAYKVENYPGFFNISGKELTKKFKTHQKYLKVPLKKERVEAIKKTGKTFEISSNKDKYQTKSLILSFGTETKKLKIKNIEKFEGKGVNYRVGNNAFLFKNKVVAIVGGANAAVMSAVSLAKAAEKVYLIYRRERLRASAMWVERVKKLKNVEIIYKTNVVDLEGKNRLEKIVLDNKKQLKINGLVIEVGGVPNTFLIHDLGIKTDKNGYIKTDKTQATNVKGIFAAGDATTGSNEFRQIITACSEAAVAVLGVFNYLSK